MIIAFLAVLAALVVLAAAALLTAQLLRRTPHGKLDVEVAFALRFTGAAGVDTSLPVAELRDSFTRKVQAFHGKLPEMAAVRDTEVRVEGRGAVPIRIYTPGGDAPGGGTPKRILLFFHGGGFVEGNILSHENICRHLARASGRIVASVDYGLAPESQFPQPLEDCYAALAWASREASKPGDLAGATAEGLAVAGDSAGGTASAVLCLMARERGGPRIAGQVLIYPSTDISHLDTESHRHFGRGYMLDTAAMAWFRAQYLPDPRDYTNPWASPLLAESLAGLPPALVITAFFDVLRDEGRAYADRLAAAGVPVTYCCTPGVPHGYLSGTRFLKRRTGEDFARIARFLRELDGR